MRVVTFFLADKKSAPGKGGGILVPLIIGIVVVFLLLVLSGVVIAGVAAVAVVNELGKDLPDVNRFETGQFQIQSEPVELSSLVRDTLPALATQAAGHQVRIDLQIEDQPLWIAAASGSQYHRSGGTGVSSIRRPSGWVVTMANRPSRCTMLA